MSVQARETEILKLAALEADLAFPLWGKVAGGDEGADALE